MVIDTHTKNPSQDSKADPIFSLAHMPYLLLFGFLNVLLLCIWISTFIHDNFVKCIWFLKDFSGYNSLFLLNLILRPLFHKILSLIIWYHLSCSLSNHSFYCHLSISGDYFHGFTDPHSWSSLKCPAMCGTFYIPRGLSPAHIAICNLCHSC